MEYSIVNLTCERVTMSTDTSWLFLPPQIEAMRTNHSPDREYKESQTGRVQCCKISARHTNAINTAFGQTTTERQRGDVFFKRSILPGATKCRISSPEKSLFLDPVASVCVPTHTHPRAILGQSADFRFCAGKSSLTVQFVENHFVESYYPTIENTFSKTIKYKGQEYTTEIIDTAGQVFFAFAI
jgi:hypothetical protein